MRHVTNRMREGLAASKASGAAAQPMDLDVGAGTAGTHDCWAGWLPAGGLGDDLALELAWQWRSEGEHCLRWASIFASSSLALARSEAPERLFLACRKASLDELNHARMALGLAARFGRGARPEPRWPVSDEEQSVDLESLAALWVGEGCVAKFIAAAVARERLRHATDPLVRRTLQVLVANHGRHANLACQIVAWAIEAGGDSVRVAVERRFEVALEWAVEVPAMLSARRQSCALNAHGQLGPFQRAHITRLAIAQIVEPCRAALLHTEDIPHVEARGAPQPVVESCGPKAPGIVFASLAARAMRLRRKGVA